MDERAYAFSKAIHSANEQPPDDAPQLRIWFADGRWRWATNWVLPPADVREIEAALERMNRRS